MRHPQKGSKVKLIKLEQGFNDHRAYIGRIGEVIKCDRHQDRRFYWVKFNEPVPELLFLYRPEIELVDEEKNDESSA